MGTFWSANVRGRHQHRNWDPLPETSKRPRQSTCSMNPKFTFRPSKCSTSPVRAATVLMISPNSQSVSFPPLSFEWLQPFHIRHWRPISTEYGLVTTGDFKNVVLLLLPQEARSGRLEMFENSWRTTAHWLVFYVALRIIVPVILPLWHSRQSYGQFGCSGRPVPAAEHRGAGTHPRPSDARSPTSQRLPFRTARQSFTNVGHPPIRLRRFGTPVLPKCK